MELNIGGKSVFVTGGGSNIGRAICHRFAQENARIVIAELDESQGKTVADEVCNMGTEALFVQMDDVTAAVVDKSNNQLTLYSTEGDSTVEQKAAIYIVKRTYNPNKGNFLVRRN